MQQKDDDKMKNNQDMDFSKTEMCSVGNKEHIDLLKIKIKIFRRFSIQTRSIIFHNALNIMDSMLIANCSIL